MDIKNQITSIIPIQKVIKSPVKSNDNNSIETCENFAFDNLRTLIAIYHEYAYFLHEEKQAQEILRSITTE